jgi:molecular chaperone DnaK (HSP70)
VSGLVAFAVRCAERLGVTPSDVRVRFQFIMVGGGQLRVRCGIHLAGSDAITRLSADGDDEGAAMAAIDAETERAHASTLADQIEALKKAKRDAIVEAAQAERERDAKVKELRRTQERAARAAKAFQKALGEDDDTPRLPGAKGEDDDGH